MLNLFQHLFFCGFRNEASSKLLEFGMAGFFCIFAFSSFLSWILILVPFAVFLCKSF